VCGQRPTRKLRPWSVSGSGSGQSLAAPTIIAPEGAREPRRAGFRGTAPGRRGSGWPLVGGAHRHGPAGRSPRPSGGGPQSERSSRARGTRCPSWPVYEVLTPAAHNFWTKCKHAGLEFILLGPKREKSKRCPRMTRIRPRKTRGRLLFRSGNPTTPGYGSGSGSGQVAAIQSSWAPIIRPSSTRSLSRLSRDRRRPWSSGELGRPTGGSSRGASGAAPSVGDRSPRSCGSVRRSAGMGVKRRARRGSMGGDR
jgi:hypothetical protein